MINMEYRIFMFHMSHSVRAMTREYSLRLIKMEERHATE